jgi:hypothetical protein
VTTSEFLRCGHAVEEWREVPGTSGSFCAGCLQRMKRERFALERIHVEVQRAIELHGPLSGPHEGFAVIREELDELWDAVKRDDLEDALEEAVQVGAMAVRFLADLGLPVP